LSLAAGCTLGMRIGSCRRVRRLAPLLPIAQRACGDAASRGEFFLAEPQHASQRTYARHEPHAACRQVLLGDGPGIRIGHRRRVALLLRHSVEQTPIERRVGTPCPALRGSSMIWPLLKGLCGTGRDDADAVSTEGMGDGEQTLLNHAQQHIALLSIPFATIIHLRGECVAEGQAGYVKAHAAPCEIGRRRPVFPARTPRRACWYGLAVCGTECRRDFASCCRGERLR
jgi:hypothetical protein